MKFKINSSELLKRLENANKVVNSKNTLPILGDILFQVKGNVVYLTASDSDVWLSLKCQATDSDCDFSFCVNAKDILEIIRNVNESEITVSVEDRTATWDYGNGQFCLPIDNHDDFPKPTREQMENSVLVDVKSIRDAIKTTMFATTESEIRPFLNGVHFELSEECMSVSATDTFELALYKDTSIKTDTACNITVPKKSCIILSSVLNNQDGDVRMSFNKSSLEVQNGHFKLTSRLIECNYPNCESVILRSYPIEVTIDRVCLIQTLKRVIPASEELSNLVVLFFENGSLTVTADNASFSKSASETISCDCSGDIKIGFKGSSLLEILRNMEDDNITIMLESPTRGAIFRPCVEDGQRERILLLQPSIL